MYEGVIQHVLSLTQKKPEKQNTFSLFINIIPFNINALRLTMLRHCNPITVEGSILALQKFLHNTFSLKWRDLSLMELSLMSSQIG